MFRSLLAAATLAGIAGTTLATTPAAQAQVAQSMPDYIININKETSLLGVWTVTSPSGTTTADYRSDGSVSGYMTIGRNPQRIPFYGFYTVKHLGQDRIRLSVTLPMPGKRGPQRLTETLRFQPDGTLYSETAGTTAYRLR